MSHEYFHEPPDPALLTAAQWRAMSAFVLVGAIAIITGGLLAAITRPAGVAAGAWVAAYPNLDAFTRITDLDPR